MAIFAPMQVLLIRIPAIGTYPTPTSTSETEFEFFVIVFAVALTLMVLVIVLSGIAFMARMFCSMRYRRRENSVSGRRLSLPRPIAELPFTKAHNDVVCVMSAAHLSSFSNIVFRLIFRMKMTSFMLLSMIVQWSVKVIMIYASAKTKSSSVIIAS